MLTGEEPTDAFWRYQDKQGDDQQAHADVFHDLIGEQAQTLNVLFAYQQSANGIDRGRNAAQHHL